MTLTQAIILAVIVAFLLWLVCKAACISFFSEKREFVNWLVQKGRGSHAEN